MTADHGITVTIKYGKGYEVPWAVFKAASVAAVRADIISYFGLSPEVVSELTLNELVNNASQVAQGIGNAAVTLGAVAIPRATVSDAPVNEGNPWTGIGENEAEHKEWPAHPHQAVLDAFLAAPNTKELQKVWAANQPAFEDPSVVAAYKARGKELSSK